MNENRTIRIPKDTWKQIKIMAAEDDKKISEWVTELVIKELTNRKRKSK